MRATAWSTFIETVKQHERRIGHKVNGVLVIAREWYSGNRRDDSVNKRAARIALATGLGVPVQYLRPREESERDFENRLMIAWLDLAYKSLGRVRPGKLLKVYNTPDLFGSYPDRILALGVVRRNKSRFLANERSFLPYTIELDVGSGVCAASFAYENLETRLLTWSERLQLPQALVKLASLGPVQLTSAKDNCKKHLEERTQTFFKERL